MLQTSPDSWAGQAGLKPGELFRDRLESGSEGPEMVVIPAGKFRMGDIQGKHGNDELPVREVIIKRSFAVSRYEVTFDQYDGFVTLSPLDLDVDRMAVTEYGRVYTP